jgi:hypothetical protein
MGRTRTGIHRGDAEARRKSLKHRGKEESEDGEERDWQIKCQAGASVYDFFLKYDDFPMVGTKVSRFRQSSR